MKNTSEHRRNAQKIMTSVSNTRRAHKPNEMGAKEDTPEDQS